MEPQAAIIASVALLALLGIVIWVRTFTKKDEESKYNLKVTPPAEAFPRYEYKETTITTLPVKEEPVVEAKKKAPAKKAPAKKKAVAAKKKAPAKKPASKAKSQKSKK